MMATITVQMILLDMILARSERCGNILSVLKIPTLVRNETWMLLRPPWAADYSRP